MSAPPSPSPAAPASGHAEPSFWLALRGVCLLAWKAQWTWKRLPWRLVSAFALPLLAYLVVPSQKQWQERHTIMGDPKAIVISYFARLDREKIPIEEERRAKLLSLFQEEYSRAESQMFNSQLAAQPLAALREENLTEVAPPIDLQPVIFQPQEILPVEIVPIEIQLVQTQSVAIQPMTIPQAEIRVPATVEELRVELVNACINRIQSRAREFLSEAQHKPLRLASKRAWDRARQRAQEKMGNWAEPFYRLLIDFYFFIVVPLECVRQCGGLIREEAQAGTLSFLATRPLSRAKLLAAKYLAQTGWLQASLLAQTLLLFMVGGLRGVPALGALLPLLLGAQVLAVFAWSALGIFLGQATNRYMAMALVYGTVVELGIGRIPTNINALSMMRHLKTLLANNPDLQALYEWPATGVPFSLFALVAGVGLFLGLAAALYSWLEYHHVSEMQK